MMGEPTTVGTHAESNGSGGLKGDDASRERGGSRPGRVHVLGWEKLSRELKVVLKSPDNQSFPMALLEAKRHVQNGLMKIPVVLDGSNAPLYFGRPTDWPPGLAGKVLRDEAHVEIMTLTVCEDTSVMLAGETDSCDLGEEIMETCGRPHFIGYAASSLQGGLGYQEDRFVHFRELSAVPMLRIAPGISFFGVYDGHGGSKVAEFLSHKLHWNFAAELKKHPRSNVAAALRAAFKRTDKEALDAWQKMSSEEKQAHGDEDGNSSGSTAVVVVLKGRDLVVAHVGDCRVALCKRGGQCLDLTTDHTYHNCLERTRVREDGGMWDGDRLDGLYAISRAFGDFEIKIGDKPKGLISDPDVTEHLIGHDDEFLLVSSDGLWADENVHGGLSSSRAAVAFARERLQENGNDLQAAADQLVREAVKASESDNTTAILVAFAELEQVVPPPMEYKEIKFHKGPPKFVNMPSAASSAPASSS